MKTTTQVRAAVKLCYDAYADYCRIVKNIPMIPPVPKVSYHAGKGWLIEGKLWECTAEEVINEFGRKANVWWDKVTFYQRDEMNEPAMKEEEEKLNRG